MATRSPHPADPHQPDSAASAELAPVDPHAAVPASVPAETSRDPHIEQLDTTGGRLGSAWVGLVLGALVTILLLIFVAQNTTSTEVSFLGWQFTLPLGVLILFAAIAGALIMALFAGFRILQLRMRARKVRKISARR